MIWLKLSVYTDLAHLGEHIPYKDRVEGSSPSIGTKIRLLLKIESAWRVRLDKR